MSANIYNCPWFTKTESGLIAAVDLQRLSYYAGEVLLIGDVQLSARVVIEIKRIKRSRDPANWEDYNDLAASLKDDRVHRETQNAHANFEVNYLILEVEEGASVTGGWFDQQKLDSLLQTLELSFSTIIKVTHSQDETIALIYTLFDHEAKGPKYVPPTNPEPKPMTWYGKQQYFLSGLIGVGAEKSDRLLTEVGPPAVVLNRIINTKVVYTKSGKPKGVEPEFLKGFGPQFFLENQPLLLLKGKELDSEGK